MTLRSLPALAWTALILFLCLAPGWWFAGSEEVGEPSWLDRLLGPMPLDKVVHFGIFAVFGGLWRWAGASTRRTLAGGLGLAVLTELGQSIPGLERTTDLDDLLADVLGLGAALLICRPRRARVPEPAATA